MDVPYLICSAYIALYFKMRFIFSKFLDDIRYMTHIIRLLPFIIQHSFCTLIEKFYSGKKLLYISWHPKRFYLLLDVICLLTRSISIFPQIFVLRKQIFLVTIWIFMFSLIFDVVVGNFLGHYKNFVRAFWKIKTLYYDKWNLY